MAHPHAVLFPPRRSAPFTFLWTPQTQRHNQRAAPRGWFPLFSITCQHPKRLPARSIRLGFFILHYMDEKGIFAKNFKGTSMKFTRSSVAALTLSASAFVALVVSEGYTDKAVIPTEGDRPTHGFGSTFNADGSPVRTGDTTTPVRALVTARAHLSKEEKVFQDSLPGATLNQPEYDLYMDWVYQYGSGAWLKSSMRKNILAGEHRQACDALLRYRFAAGYDCSTTVNGKPNRRCWGVWVRQQERHQSCMAAQS